MSNDFFDSGDYTAAVANTLVRAGTVNAMMQAIEAGFDRLPDEDEIKENRVNAVTAEGTANALTVTISTPNSSYQDKMRFLVETPSSNTGATTVNVNSWGVKAIKRPDGDDLEANDLVADSIADLVYNGTNGYFILMNSAALSAAAGVSASAAAASAAAASSSASDASGYASAASASASAAASSAAALPNASSIGDGNLPQSTGSGWRALAPLTYNHFTTSGSANTYVLTLSPEPTAYASGMKIRFKMGAGITNTGASTVNVNSLGAKDLRRNGGAVLVADDLIAGCEYEFTYDSTNGYFVATSPLGQSSEIGAVEEDDGASTGPTISTNRVSASPAAFDNLGQFIYRGRNSVGSTVVYAGITGVCVSPTGGAEYGGLNFYRYHNGASDVGMRLRQGLYSKNASGGDKGADSINFTEVYADGILVSWTGKIEPTFFSSPPSGWLLINGDSLGDTGSGATHTGSTYQALYTHIYDNISDTYAPVSGGRGASASADWDAGKTLTMPDGIDKMLIGAGSTYAVGETGGASTVTLVDGNLPTTTIRDPAQTTSCPTGDSVPTNVAKALNTTFGNDEAFSIINPFMACNWMIRI